MTNVALWALGLTVSAAVAAPAGAACDPDTATCLADPVFDCQEGVNDSCSHSVDQTVETGPGFLVWAATHPGEAMENLCEVDGFCI